MKNTTLFTFEADIEEATYINAVYEARKSAGLSKDLNQFLRQAINFAVNHQRDWNFGRPSSITTVQFKNLKND